MSHRRPLTFSDRRRVTASTATISLRCSTGLEQGGWGFRHPQGQQVTVKRGVRCDVPEGDELDLGECRDSRRNRPRARDGERNDRHGHAGRRATGWRHGAAASSTAGVVPFQRGAPTTAKQVGQIPANYTEASGTVVSGTPANQATQASLAAYPGGVVDRVVQLSTGEYEVHNIGVNWPHHVFVTQDFKAVGAN
jgi:hypothetical protein